VSRRECLVDYKIDTRFLVVVSNNDEVLWIRVDVSIDLVADFAG
jgi:hypothetical protein